MQSFVSQSYQALERWQRDPIKFEFVGPGQLTGLDARDCLQRSEKHTPTLSLGSSRCSHIGKREDPGDEVKHTPGTFHSRSK